MAIFLWHSFQLLENTNDLFNIWKLLPIDWRLSWYENFRLLIDENENIGINSGGIHFYNQTEELEKFKKDLNSWKRVSVEECMNRQCVPTVRCPWGCTEYIEKSVFLSFGLYLYALKPIKFIVAESYFTFQCGMVTVTWKNCFNGMRPDYLSLQDYVLKNPE